jgi:hypothetical protein
MAKVRLIGLLFCVLLAACATDGSEPDGQESVVGSPNDGTVGVPVSPAESDAAEGAEPSPRATEPAVAEPPELAPVVVHPNPQAAIAISDLAERLGADVQAIKVLSIDEVTWRDSSLGCPEPGMMYTQALVEGARIVLEYDGVSYDYHSGPRTDPFFCAEPTTPVAGDPGDA